MTCVSLNEGTPPEKRKKKKRTHTHNQTNAGFSLPVIWHQLQNRNTSKCYNQVCPTLPTTGLTLPGCHEEPRDFKDPEQLHDVHLPVKGKGWGRFNGCGAPPYTFHGGEVFVPICEMAKPSTFTQLQWNATCRGQKTSSEEYPSPPIILLKHNENTINICICIYIYICIQYIIYTYNV